MTEAPAADGSQFAASDIEALARDWITLWQSELASYASDREAAEAWVRLLSLWAGAMTSLITSLPRPASAGADDGPAGRPGASSEARAAAAHSAPDPGLAALERIDQRLAALEERLAALEQRAERGRPASGNNSRPARRTRRGGIQSRGTG